MRNTPGIKIDRLSRYIGISPTEIKSEKTWQEIDTNILNQLKSLLNAPVFFDEKWWEFASKTTSLVEQYLPVGSLSLLLQNGQKWSEKHWGQFWLETTIALIQQYLKVHTSTQADKIKVAQFMNHIIAKKTDQVELTKLAKDTLDLCVIY